MQVRFDGANDAQVKWGINHDPREWLIVGNVYSVLNQEIHTWHTKISLVEFPDLKFNDASFTYLHE